MLFTVEYVLKRHKEAIRKGDETLVCSDKA
jgi:hypothetical protein